jgi:hypothetical protein
MKFSSYEQAINTVMLGKTTNFLAMRKHTHDEDCAFTCAGFYASIDLIGDGFEEGDPFKPTALEVPPAILRAAQVWTGESAPQQHKRLTSMGLRDRLTNEWRETAEGAWQWHGRPSLFLLFPSLIWVDRCVPWFTATIITPDLKYASSGLGTRLPAMYELFETGTHSFLDATLRLRRMLIGLAFPSLIFEANVSLSPDLHSLITDSN